MVLLVEQKSFIGSSQFIKFFFLILNDTHIGKPKVW